MMNAFDRMDTESAKAFKAFRVYCELGADRSLSKTREKLGKRAGYDRVLQTWSSKYNWVARAQAYDVSLAVQTDEQVVDARQELLNDSLADYRLALGAWRQAFNDLVPSVPADPKAPNAAAKPARVDAEQLQRLIKTRRDIDSMGRLALGMPETVKEDRLAGKDGGDLVIEFQALPDDDDGGANADRTEDSVRTSFGDAEPDSE